MSFPIIFSVFSTNFFVVNFFNQVYFPCLIMIYCIWICILSTGLRQQPALDLRKTCKILRPFLPTEKQQEFEGLYSIMIDAVNDMDVVRNMWSFSWLLYLFNLLFLSDFIFDNFFIVFFLSSPSFYNYCFFTPLFFDF